MAPESTILLWSVVLAMVYLMTHGALMRMQIGLPRSNANRDHDPEPNLHSARAIRAFRNFLETYPMFIALVVVIAMTQTSSSVSVWGGWIWFGARVLYLPAYILGFGRSRSVIWVVSLVGLGLMFIGAAGYGP